MSGQIFLEQSEISINETGGQVFIPIVRSGDLSQPVTIQFATTAGSATSGNDYTDVAGTITMAAGQDRVVVPVDILNDVASEATEDFTLSLINVDSGALLFPRTTKVSILDDENPITDPPNPPLTSDYSVSQTTVIDGLTQPIAFEFLPNSSTLGFVAEKGGRIFLHDFSDGTQLSEVLDLTDQVNNRQDRGLLDIAVHPDLDANPYLYAFYVVDPPGTQGQSGNAGPNGGGNRYSHVVRYTLDESTGYTSVVPGSDEIIVGGAGQSLSDISGNGAVDSTSNFSIAASDIDPATGEFIDDYLKVDSRSHAGGSIEIGPDGALYITTGDGTSFNAVDPRSVDVQDINSLSGKVLRVDAVTGQGLSDNPFATSDLDGNASKVYQLGLRNPFSMSFDKEGQLIVTDTGWNSWEELNVGGPGANFGWPFYEGGDNGQLRETGGYRNLPEAAQFYADVAAGTIEITPAFRGFAHSSSAPGFQVQAITGADDLIDSDRYPEELQGAYIFTDVSQGEVFAVNINDPQQLDYLFTTANNFGPVHLKQGPDGYMYYADLVTGVIGRLEISVPRPGTMTADYFDLPNTVSSLDDVDFTASPDFTETVRTIEQSTNGSFYDGGPSNYFAARYTDTFEIEEAGSYTFFLTSDDGSRLFVDGVELIDMPDPQSATLGTGSISLTAGQHTIEVLYFEQAGAASVDLDWSGPGFGRTQMIFEEPEGDPTTIIEGTPGDDFLIGTDGNDLVLGNGGQDTMLGSLGDDTFIGSPNSYDQVDYFDVSTDFVFTQNADGTITAAGPDGTDTLVDVDGIWFIGEERWYDIRELLVSGGGPIVGTTGDDILFGTSGDDVMIGNGGSDQFIGSPGDDDIRGDDGVYDQVNYADAASDYTFTENPDGTVTVTGVSTGTDTLTSIEGFWFNGEERWYDIAELLQPAGGDDIIGTTGDDFLIGTDGDETMIGNGGRDEFLPGDGSHTIIGDAGVYDQVNYDGAASDYTFTQNGDGTVTVVGPTGTDQLTEIDGFWFIGESRWYDINQVLQSDGDIIGTTGDDLLFGTDGDDVMIGNGGSDQFLPFAGSDTIIGDDGEYDQVNYDGAASDFSFVRNGDGTITVTGALTGTDTLTSIEGFWFQGEERWYDVNELVPATASAAARSAAVNLPPESSGPVVLDSSGSPVVLEAATEFGNLDGDAVSDSLVRDFRADDEVGFGLLDDALI